MKKPILAISGKPGLFMLLSQGRNTIIVETIDSQKRRLSVGIHDKIISLNDISIYTTEEDTPLMTVFENIQKMTGGKTIDIDPKTASKDQLYSFMKEVLPEFDSDRVYPGDIRKVIVWYNILVNNGLDDFKVEEESAEEPAAEESTENK